MRGMREAVSSKLLSSVVFPIGEQCAVDENHNQYKVVYQYVMIMTEALYIPIEIIVISSPVISTMIISPWEFIA